MCELKVRSKKGAGVLGGGGENREGGRCCSSDGHWGGETVGEWVGREEAREGTEEAL